MTKWVYTFGNGKAEGGAGDYESLGGKGANLAEMCNLGLPVPPGLTIVSQACTFYYKNGRNIADELKPQVMQGLKQMEAITGRKFGDTKRPLLVSVRSGGRASMPGMMDTVLNLGLNDATVQALGHDAGDARFAWDSYRRFIQMYADVVMGLDNEVFEEILEDEKARFGHEFDTDLTAVEWQYVVSIYKTVIEEELGVAFPQEPEVQLWGAVGAVFSSWMNPRAVTYRHPAQYSRSLGVPPSIFRRWFSAISAIRPPPVLPSPAIRRPARRSYTANSSSMRRVRMSSLASARRRALQRPPASPPATIVRRWKR